MASIFEGKYVINERIDTQVGEVFDDHSKLVEVMCGEAYEIKEFALTGHLDGGLAHHLGSHT
jgi:hypothetical protein